MSRDGPGRVADALAADGPVAYFTLGTVKNADTDFATGLYALAEYDGLVIATTGRRLDPGELGAVPGNVIVEEFVPGRRAGAGRLLVSQWGPAPCWEAWCTAFPRSPSRKGPTNHRTPHCSSGPAPEWSSSPEDYAVETIRAAVSKVTGDRSYRLAAGRLRDEIAAMPDADEVWAGIAGLP